MDRFRLLDSSVDGTPVRMNGMKIQIVLLWWTVACLVGKLIPVFTLPVLIVPLDLVLWLGSVVVGIIIWKWCR